MQKQYSDIFPVGKLVQLPTAKVMIEADQPRIVKFGRSLPLTGSVVLIQNRPITWGQVRTEVAR